MTDELYLELFSYVKYVIFAGITVIYGGKWLPAVAVLQVLCLYGLNKALLKTTENLYLAAGKPGIITKINLYQFTAMLILIYPLTIKYGILGTGIAATVPSAMMVLLTFHEAGKIIDKSFLTIVKNIAPASVGSLVMVSLVVLLQQFVSHLSPALVLVLSIGLGAVSYSVFIWLTQKEELGEIRELIKRK